MTGKHWLGPITALVFIASPVSAGIVNVDLNGPGGATHAGADGALSSTGAAWNGVLYNVDAPSLVDETGASTPTSLVYLRTRPLGPFLDFAAPNNLQDDGMTGEGFEIRGLDANYRYTLAIYSSANAVFNLYDAAGNHGGRCSSAPPTYLLPGIEGRDYCRFLNLVPFEVAPGQYGIRLNGLQGSVTGLQLLGTPPPDVTAPACSGTVLAGTPGAVEMHIRDTESGLASIQVTVSENATGNAPPFAAGTRNEVVFTVHQVDPYQITRVEVTSRDVAGNSSACNFEIAAAPPPDITAPTCSGESFEGPPAGVTVHIQDTDSGLASIVATQSQNANVNVPSFPTGTQNIVTVEVTQIDPYQAARVELASTDGAGNRGTCVFEIAAGTPPPPVDAEPPLCSGTVQDGPPARLDIRVQDSQSGLASITLVSGDNVTVSVPEFASGTNEPMVFTASKADPSLIARIEIASSDVAGNTVRRVFEIPAESAAGPCQNPEGCCEETMGFFKTAAERGELNGQGPGKSGLAHRRVFERQLERICELIGSDHPQDACRELALAIKRVDGRSSPEDFVTGPAAPQMAERLRDLATKLGCSARPVTQTPTIRSNSAQVWSEPVSWGLLKSLYDTSQ